MGDFCYIKEANVGALTIRIEFWGIIYYSYNKDPPQNSIGNYLSPYVSADPHDPEVVWAIPGLLICAGELIGTLRGVGG